MGERDRLAELLEQAEGITNNEPPTWEQKANYLLERGVSLDLKRIKRKAKLRRAIAHYGDTMQISVAIEEMAELQKELVKSLRGFTNHGHIAEEIADVEIMLEQLKIIFSNGAWVDEWKDAKVKRLEQRIALGE